MAPSTNSLILSLKVVLISIGTISLAMLVKASIPLVLYELPTIWTGVITAVIAWLKPPYLYVVINGIIIIIAATSRSGSNQDWSGSEEQVQPLVTARTPPPSDLIAISQSELIHSSVQREVKVFEAAAPVPVNNEREVFEVMPVLVNGAAVVAVNHEDEDVIPKSVIADPLPETEIRTENELLLLTATEKPLISSRFSHRKPPVKASHEVSGLKTVRMTRSKKPETLENTWKMITEGRRHVPVTRHFTKSDTFQGRHVTVVDDDAPEEENENLTAAVPPPQQHRQRHVLKSETFKDRTNYDSPKSSPSAAAAAKLLKEPSPSADELNRRVEAFIKKFNEDMRLQRQQSIQQYMEMINRGV